MVSLREKRFDAAQCRPKGQVGMQFAVLEHGKSPIGGRFQVYCGQSADIRWATPRTRTGPPHCADRYCHGSIDGCARVQMFLEAHNARTRERFIGKSPDATWLPSPRGSPSGPVHAGARSCPPGPIDPWQSMPVRTRLELSTCPHRGAAAIAPPLAVKILRAVAGLPKGGRGARSQPVCGVARCTAATGCVVAGVVTSQRASTAECRVCMPSLASRAWSSVTSGLPVVSSLSP